MSTLIDALKQLHKRMDECAEQEVGCFADLLLEIIAEHERSAEPVKLFYQPSDSEIRLMLLELSNEAMEYDIELGLPIKTNGAAFNDPCSLVELVRQHMSNWRESAE